VAADGRIVIPVEYRRALGVQPGDEIMISLEEGEVHLSTRAQARKRAQDLVCRLVPQNRSLVDELIRERKAEAARG